MPFGCNAAPPFDTSGPPPDQKHFVPALHRLHMAVDGVARWGSLC
jgi:hypothetical protein